MFVTDEIISGGCMCRIAQPSTSQFCLIDESHDLSVMNDPSRGKQD